MLIPMPGVLAFVGVQMHAMHTSNFMPESFWPVRSAHNVE